jgi:hypothetical protein
LQESFASLDVFSTFWKWKLMSHSACTTSYKNMQWYILVGLTVSRVTRFSWYRAPIDGKTDAAKIDIEIFRSKYLAAGSPRRFQGAHMAWARRIARLRHAHEDASCGLVGALHERCPETNATIAIRGMRSLEHASLASPFSRTPIWSG